MYRGEFLQGFSLKDSPEFEQWLLAKREYYKRQVLQILHGLAEACQQSGEYEQALAYARRQLELDPWLEEAHRQVMRLLAASGQRSAALVPYETCRRVLQNELGVEPVEETFQLYEQIRSGVLVAPPGPITSLQLEASQAKEQSSLPGNNLPASLSSFVGREREIEQIRGMITDPACRLVTLTGSGGVGKTRLVLRVTQELLEEYPDGVWLVELASLADPGLVPPSVAEVFGVQESKDYTLLGALANTLRARQLLLVLDNCEHLVEASASLAGKLLQACPNLHILATSR